MTVNGRGELFDVFLKEGGTFFKASDSQDIKSQSADEAVGWKASDPCALAMDRSH